jgi:tight adherence protein C
MGIDLEQFGAVVVAATFISMGALFYGVMKLLNPERTARDRVVDLTGGRREADSLVNMSTTASVTSNIASLARPKDEDESDKLRRELVVAGFRNRNALEIYSVLRVIMLIVVPALLLMPVLHFLPDDLPRFKFWLYTTFFGTLGASVGYFGPTLMLRFRLAARKETLLRPFPDALDLLVSSVEAGLGLDAALRRVAAEMESAAPELARELQMVNHETAAGLPRLDALRRLDYRTGLAEVNSLVNTLVQA